MFLLCMPLTLCFYKRRFSFHTLLRQYITSFCKKSFCIVIQLFPKKDDDLLMHILRLLLNGVCNGRKTVRDTNYTYFNTREKSYKLQFSKLLSFILFFVEFNKVGNTENNAITPLDEFNVLHSRTLNIFRLIRVIIACHQRHLPSSNYFSD